MRLAAITASLLLVLAGCTGVPADDDLHGAAPADDDPMGAPDNEHPDEHSDGVSANAGPQTVRQVHQRETGTAQFGPEASCLFLPLGGVVWYFSQHLVDLDGVDHVKWQLADGSAGLEFNFTHDGASSAWFGFLNANDGGVSDVQEAPAGEAITGSIPANAGWATFYSCAEDSVAGTFESYVIVPV